MANYRAKTIGKLFMSGKEIGSSDGTYDIVASTKDDAAELAIAEAESIGLTEVECVSIIELI